MKTTALFFQVMEESLDFLRANIGPNGYQVAKTASWYYGAPPVQALSVPPNTSAFGLGGVANTMGETGNVQATWSPNGYVESPDQNQKVKFEDPVEISDKEAADKLEHESIMAHSGVNVTMPNRMLTSAIGNSFKAQQLATPNNIQISSSNLGMSPNFE